MALGVDIVIGTLPSESDGTAHSLAKKIKDTVDGYANKQDDVVQMTAVVYGTNQAGVILLHK